MGRNFYNLHRWLRPGGIDSMETAVRFFTGDGPVFEALYDVTELLNRNRIPYLVVGGFAVFAHGYRRLTTNVDLIVTRYDLPKIGELLASRGYRPAPGGAEFSRDDFTEVRFLAAGDYPGDNQAKPVRFPDPVEAATDKVHGIPVITLEGLFDLKLTSGMDGGITRLNDFADVIEIIKVIRPPVTLAQSLHPTVREKYLEFWHGLNGSIDIFNPDPPEFTGFGWPARPTK